MENTLAHPFDAAAAEYDSVFSDRVLGRWLRNAVQRHLAEVFRPGGHVLELGCGTGEDAIWLAGRGVRVTATDVSPAMLDRARHKAEAAGVAHRVAFATLDLAALPVAPTRAGHHALDGPDVNAIRAEPGDLEGAFSNFGALNCLPDRRRVARYLAHLVRPGGRVVLVVMGPLCPWEVAWHLAHGQARPAFRRLRPGTLAHVGDGATIRVWYPSPRCLRAEFRPHFRHVRTVGIGSLLPPSYLADLVDRRPRLFARLGAAERRLEGTFPATVLNDHYLSIFERVPEESAT